MSHRQMLHISPGIHGYLRDHPGATIDEISDRLDLDPEQVARTLDEVSVEGGGYVHYGPGQGGGWIDEQLRQELARDVSLESVESGWRWPDGLLRDEVFDPLNPAHLLELSLA